MRAKERPILFSSEMVRAILDGRKTQTRRLVKADAATLAILDKYAGVDGHGGASIEVDGGTLSVPLRYPYGVVGDRLYVKETWKTGVALDALSPSRIAEKCIDAGYPRPWAPLWFASDGHSNENGTLRDFGGEWGKVRQSIFMPRWASRITLEVTDVRTQRLQEISEEDAKAEGVEPVVTLRKLYPRKHAAHSEHLSYPEGVHRLWDAINGKRSPWASNPRVWAITFKRLP